MKLINHKLAVAICLSLGISACTPEKTTEEYLSSAKTSISENKNAEAAIELKNAIRKDLKNAEARYLLGTLYLNEGQAAAAEKEFIRALELGEDVNIVLPELLRALNLQSKHIETLEAIAQAHGIAEENIPTVKLYAAIANLRLGNDEQAQEDISEANEVSTESAFTKLGKAIIEADAENTDVSLELVEGVIATNPNLIEALLLKGQLYYTKGDYASAIEAYNQYFFLVPKDLTIRMYLANAYVKNQQFSEANEHIDFILESYPEHAFLNQLKAVVEFENQEWERALRHVEKAIHSGLNTYPNRLIAGLSAFKLEKYETAHANLIILQDIISPNHPMHRVLAVVQMQLGYQDQAEQTLVSLDDISESDVDLLVGASFELLKTGKTEGARTLIEKVESFQLNDAEDIAKIGVLKLSLDDLEGITDLKKALELSPELSSAQIALGMGYLQNKDYINALKIAKELQGESGEIKAFGDNLEAKIYLNEGKTEEANKVVDSSLVEFPDNIYALNFKAEYYYNKKENKLAEEWVNKALKISPDNITALQLYYALVTQSEDINTELAYTAIKNAYEKYPDSFEYQDLYIKSLFTDKQYEKIITVFLKEKNTSLLTKIAVGNSLIAMKRIDDAVTFYKEWLNISPKNPMALVGMIQTLDLLNDYQEALVYARKLADGVPNTSKVNIYFLHYLVLNKNFKEAQELYGKLDKSIQNKPAVKGIYGELLLGEGNYKKALTFLQPAYEENHSTHTAKLIYFCRVKLDQKNIGLQFLEQHLKNTHQDLVITILFANEIIEEDKVTAKKLYLSVLDIQPDNALALNNLAWIELELKNYSMAKSYAVKADKLFPGNAQILDTLGMIEMGLNNKDKAILYFTKALNLSPQDVLIKSHLEEANNSL